LAQAKKLLLDSGTVLKSGLTPMTLKNFLRTYREDICRYYDLEDYEQALSNLYDKESVDAILCMVDTKKYASPPQDKKFPRKAGSYRRNKWRHKFSYDNPLNRIIAFASLEHCSHSPEDKKVVKLPVIGSTYFSSIRGAGKDLMNILSALAKVNDYTHMVLEVANEHAGEGHESEDEFEEEYYSDDSSDEDSEDEEVDELDEVIEIVAHELWRKTVRVDKETSVPYYNLSESYIEAELYNHLYNISKSHEENDEEERVELTPLFDCDEDGEEIEPRDTSYGGFWYRRGKKSQEMLLGFYEHMGFVEAPEVHKEWGCFSNIPYPTMMKVL
tara:strand:- start:474 stop:1460 length:987 start_codon:yes stop_codon:yes gene_type:complete